MVRGLTSLALVTAISLTSGCDKPPPTDPEPVGPVETPEAKEEHPKLDAATDLLVQALAHNDFDSLADHSAPPLKDDLSLELFQDLSNIIQHLGGIKSEDWVSSSPYKGGELGQYNIVFENGTAELELGIEEDGRINHFHFRGDDFFAAEHAVIPKEEWALKIFDWHWVDEDGNPNEKGHIYPPGHVNYDLHIGGLDAKEGVHHVEIHKVVKDEKGKVVFDEPLEVDLDFKENAEGYGVAPPVSGYVDIEKPGKYTFDLIIHDTLTGEKVTYETEVVIEG